MSKAAENTNALTEAIDDIRHQLIEQPWFGREVTGNIEAPQQSESFESFYGISQEQQEPDFTQSAEELQQDSYENQLEQDEMGQDL